MNEWPDEAREVSMPEWQAPMLATLTHNYFSDSGWIYERKFDGERCLAYRRNGKVRLYSRNRKSLNETYPELVDALEKQRNDFIVDGEIVAFEGQVTSFSRLQQRMQKKADKSSERSVKVYYYVFDLLYYDGYDLTEVALRKRKALLKRVLDYGQKLRYTPHRNEDGETYHKEACQKGWEGIIAKKADSTYQSSRSREWLKFKCVNQQEFVIVGYTDPQGERTGFGALLIAYYEDDELHYAGQVGTGYNEKLLKQLHNRLKKITRQSSPVVDEDVPTSGVHWVKPSLVGEVGFTEWTRKGRLRHPRFLGLRRDKDPKDVVREDS